MLMEATTHRLRRIILADQHDTLPECENKIKTLNQMIQELHDLIEIKNNGINMLEQQIYLLEKFSKT